jgi:hypothetical protein
MRPYKYLMRAVGAQVRLEALMVPEHCEHIQWTTIIKFAATAVIVGKAGVRTYFWQLGNGPQKQGSSDEILIVLRGLNKQPYPVYAIVDERGEQRKSFSLSELLRGEPGRGNVIIGVKFDGSQEKLFRSARRADASLKWVKYTEG